MAIQNVANTDFAVEPCDARNPSINDWSDNALHDKLGSVPNEAPHHNPLENMRSLIGPSTRKLITNSDINNSLVPAKADANFTPTSNSCNDDIEEDATICWICCDSASDVPLIQPCACRGSMSSIHASCIEEWIQHHERVTGNNQHPCCPVCQQPYIGANMRPGLTGFLGWCGGLFVRRLLQIGFLNAYIWAMRGPFLKPQVMIVVAFSFLALYKAVVIMMSLPCNIFTRASRDIRLHVEESFYGMFLLFLSYWEGQLTPQGFYPLLLLWWVTVAVLLVKMIIRFLPIPNFFIFFQGGQALMWSAGLPLAVCLGILAEDPLLLCVWVPEFFKLISIGFHITVLNIWSCAISILTMILLVVFVIFLVFLTMHPLDAGPHIFILIVACALKFACSWHIPLLVVLVVHGGLATCGIFELLFIKRLQWRDGPVWIILIYLAVFFWFILNHTILNSEFSPIGLGVQFNERNINYNDLNPIDLNRIDLNQIGLNQTGKILQLTSHGQQKTGMGNLKTGVDNVINACAIDLDICTASFFWLVAVSGFALCVEYEAWQERRTMFKLQVPGTAAPQEASVAMLQPFCFVALFCKLIFAEFGQ